MCRSISVCNEVIIDGHHRYLASLLSEFTLEPTPNAMSSAKIEYEWKNIEVVLEDWDRPEEIDEYNREYAEFNNLSLEELLIKIR